jgi:hypothetical protein
MVHSIDKFQNHACHISKYAINIYLFYKVDDSYISGNGRQLFNDCVSKCSNYLCF